MRPAERRATSPPAPRDGTQSSGNTVENRTAGHRRKDRAMKALRTLKDTTLRLATKPSTFGAVSTVVVLGYKWI
jgi:hypothetical protein